MTDPRLRSSSCASSRMSQNGEKTLVAKVRSTCSGGNSSTASWVIWKAALQTRTSTPPRASTAAAASSAFAACVRRSPGNAAARAALALDEGAGPVGVGLLLGQVREGDVGALPCEGQGHGTADAGVTTRDEGALPDEPVATGPRVLPVVGWWVELGRAPRPLLVLGRQVGGHGPLLSWGADVLPGPGGPMPRSSGARQPRAGRLVPARTRRPPRSASTTSAQAVTCSCRCHHRTRRARTNGPVCASSS